MKRKYRLGAALLALVLSVLLIAPMLAAENTTPAINWLTIDVSVNSNYYDIYYIEGLDWFHFDAKDSSKDGIIIERTTGTKVGYDAAYPVSDGLVRVKKNGKWGYIDTTGTVVVPLEYDDAGDFSDGLALVGEKDTDGNWKYGYIDTTGTLVIPLEYYAACSFSDGLAWVASMDRGDAYIDTTGTVVISENNNYNFPPTEFSDGLAWVQDDGKLGYMDTTGAVVVPCEYEVFEIGLFSDGMAWVGKKESNGDLIYGYVDKTGALVIPMDLIVPRRMNPLEAFNFSEGLAKFVKQDADGDWKYGYIDKTGTVVIPPEYDHNYLASFNENEFSGGLAKVGKYSTDGVAYGYIDTTGAVVLPLEYDEAGWIYEDVEYKEMWVGYERMSGGRYGWVVKGTSFGYFENPYWTTNSISDAKQEDGNSPNWTPNGTSDAKQENGNFPVAIVAGIAAAVVVVAVVLVVVLKKKKPAPIPVGATGPGPIPERARKASAPPSEPSPVSRPSPGPEPAPVSGPKFCSNCGKPLKPGMKFCPDCGQPLQSKEG